MKLRPALLVAILVYVALDFALPSMPGAFVFNAADSVESIQTRARASTESLALPSPSRDWLALSRPRRADASPPMRAEWVAHDKRPVPISRSRTFHDPAPPSEDPH